MTGKELMQRVRFALKDNNRALYSDWQLLVALNEALDVLYQELASFSNTAIIKSENVHLFNGRGVLPEDFLTVHEVYCGAEPLHPVTKSELAKGNGYFIDGDEIYAAKHLLTVDYKPCSPEITMDDVEDDLELPPYLNNIVKSLAIKAVKGENMEGMGKQIKNTVAGRTFNRLEMHGVWSERV